MRIGVKQFKYYLEVIPTAYIDANGEKTISTQYSVNQFEQVIDLVHSGRRIENLQVILPSPSRSRLSRMI